MYTTVDFYYQFRLMAIKISYQKSLFTKIIEDNRILANEFFTAKLPISQAIPKSFF